MNQRYAIVIEKTATGFSAFVPDLPGCIATGRDKQEVETEMKGASRFHIYGMREVGLRCTSADEYCGICCCVMLAKWSVTVIPRDGAGDQTSPRP